MKPKSRTEDRAKNPGDHRAISDRLEESLKASIWEVAMAVVALLATLFKEYLGTFWVLVLVISVIAAIAGLLLRRTRWFPLFAFVIGSTLGGVIIWGIASGVRDGHMDSLRPAVPTAEPVATPTAEPGTTQLVLREVLIGEGRYLSVLDDKVYIFCESLEYFPRSPEQESATILLRLPNRSEVRASLKLGEKMYFPVFDDTYYLTLLDIIRDQAKISITYVTPELLTPTSTY